MKGNEPTDLTGTTNTKTGAIRKATANTQLRNHDRILYHGKTCSPQEIAVFVLLTWQALKQVVAVRIWQVPSWKWHSLTKSR
jgi:hypothetical protein